MDLGVDPITGMLIFVVSGCWCLLWVDCDICCVDADVCCVDADICCVDVDVCHDWMHWRLSCVDCDVYCMDADVCYVDADVRCVDADLCHQWMYWCLSWVAAITGMLTSCRFSFQCHSRVITCSIYWVRCDRLTPCYWWLEVSHSLVGALPSDEATMAKPFDFQWQIPIPECLLKGAYFDRWEEVCMLTGYYCLASAVGSCLWLVRSLLTVLICADHGLFGALATWASFLCFIIHLAYLCRLPGLCIFICLACISSFCSLCIIWGNQ